MYEVQRSETCMTEKLPGVIMRRVGTLLMSIVAPALNDESRMTETEVFLN